jgi:hypothetical protein
MLTWRHRAPAVPQDRCHNDLSCLHSLWVTSSGRVDARPMHLCHVAFIGLLRVNNRGPISGGVCALRAEFSHSPDGEGRIDGSFAVLIMSLLVFW